MPFIRDSDLSMDSYAKNVLIRQVLNRCQGIDAVLEAIAMLYGFDRKVIHPDAVEELLDLEFVAVKAFHIGVSRAIRGNGVLVSTVGLIVISHDSSCYIQASGLFFCSGWTW